LERDSYTCIVTGDEHYEIPVPDITKDHNIVQAAHIVAFHYFKSQTPSPTKAASRRSSGTSSPNEGRQSLSPRKAVRHSSTSTSSPYERYQSRNSSSESVMPPTKISAGVSSPAKNCERPSTTTSVFSSPADNLEPFASTSIDPRFMSSQVAWKALMMFVGGEDILRHYFGNEISPGKWSYDPDKTWNGLSLRIDIHKFFDNLVFWFEPKVRMSTEKVLIIGWRRRN
jgi:hypothetical protein